MSIIKSFQFAISGIRTLLSERNFIVHLFLAVMAIGFGFYLTISPTEWLAVITCISIVLMAEGFNTAIELLCDRITLDQDPIIKRVKDMSAASVLIMAIGAATIGLMIFLPKII